MGFEIVRLDHVQLAMPPGREAEAEAFYSGLLGLSACPSRRRWRPGAAAGSATAPWRVHLGVEEDFRPARKAHPALVVHDLAALEAALRPPGWRCGRTPTARRAGAPTSTTPSATGSSSSRRTERVARPAAGSAGPRRGRRRQGRGGPSPPASPAAGGGLRCHWREGTRPPGVRVADLGGRLALHKNERRIDGVSPAAVRAVDRAASALRRRARPPSGGACVMRAPPAGSFSATMVPPSALTTWATMARPRPEPGRPRAAGER